jgi:hypothetical protein
VKNNDENLTVRRFNEKKFDKQKMMRKRDKNSRKVYHFFFGSLGRKGYLNVYIIHKLLHNMMKK